MRKMKLYLQGGENTSTARIAFFYLISTIFSQGLAFITTPIFTRLMSKTEYGQFSNFISWEGIIIVFSTLNMGTTIARAKYDYDEEMDQYLSSILIGGNIATMIMYIFVELNQKFFCEFFTMDIKYIRLLFVYLLFLPAFTFLQYKHRIYHKYRFFVVFSLITALIRTLVSIILVYSISDKFFARTIGYVIPITIFNIFLWIIVIGKGKCFKMKHLRYALMISVPLIPHTLAGNLLSNSDRIMITNMCGEEETAVYSLVYSISAVVSLVWTAMNQAWTPWLYDNMATENIKDIRDKSKVYILVFSLLVVGVLLVAPEVVLILGGENYYEACNIMPPIILGYSFVFIYGMYVNIEIFLKRTFQISLGTVMAAVLNIALNSIYIPKYGYPAAAYTTLLSYIALFLFHYYLVKREKKYNNLYDSKFIMFITGGLTLVSACSIILYRFDYIRYCMIFIYGSVFMLLFYLYKSKIIALIKRR